MYTSAGTEALQHGTFPVMKDSDKQSTDCSFPAESDSDSAISSISDESGRLNASTIDVHLKDDMGTARNNKHWRENTINTQKNQTSIPQVNPQFLQLPVIKEEAIGTYYHPAHIRQGAFLQQHGNYYPNLIEEQISTVSGTEEEIRSFAESWIRFRLQTLGQHELSYQWRRVRATYMHLLQNLTPKAARELQIVSCFHSNPDQMFYIESQLSYTYDPSYATVTGTSRNAYHSYQSH